MFIIEWVSLMTPWRIQSFETTNETELKIVEDGLSKDKQVTSYVVAQYFDGPKTLEVVPDIWKGVR